MTNRFKIISARPHVREVKPVNHMSEATLSRLDVGTPTAAEREHLAAGVGARLRTEREARGLTQRILAWKARCTPAHVGQVERGRTRPSRDLLVRLADVLRPGDPEAAAALAADLVRLAGPSLPDPTIPPAIPRELAVEILRRSLVRLGLPVDDVRVREAVTAAIREVTGGPVLAELAARPKPIGPGGDAA